MKTDYMDTSDSCDNPIDLSRRCDSVETRKTPSPSDNNSSSFVESSPSFENDSPSSLAIDARKKSVIIRSDTPPNSYQSIKYSKGGYSLPRNVPCLSATIKDETSLSPPPPSQIISHHHYKRESHHHHRQLSSLPPQINDDVINSYAMHQKLPHISAKDLPSTPSSPESTTSAPYPFSQLLRGRDGKATRPFKAYKHDTLLSNSFTPMPPTTSDTLNDPLLDERYMAFRQQMMKQIYAANGGQPTITNPKMRRTTTAASSRYTENESHEQNERDFETQSPAPQQNLMTCTSDSSEASCVTNGKGPIKDSAYYERRRKNNAAAKKSRDRRRMKEDNIVIRCAFLERENMTLKAELDAVKKHLGRFVAP